MDSAIRLNRDEVLSIMFKSAIIRLTGWYLIVLMTVSIIFSFVTYNIATNEVQTRLDRFQTHMQESMGLMPPPIGMTDFRQTEINKSTNNLFLELLYANFIILIIGGIGSYMMAKRSLVPIKEAHEAQSRFTSDASHELRTPLAVMKTELEVAINDKTATKSDLQKVLASNIEEVDRLSQLSEMLLALSRLDNDRLKLAPVDINEITKQVISKSVKQPNRISMTATGRQMINGEETAIHDLIKALVDNALQYSPEDSQISINISQTDRDIKFEITNFGKGIDPEKIPYIFDRFYRADSSRTNGIHKGYGLGLSLVKNIVDLHNGNIQVTSSPKSGTTFTVIIPSIKII